jgi:hypothetical protein
VGAHDLAGIEGAVEVGFGDARPKPLGDRPLGVRVVLRLDRDEVADGIVRRCKGRPDQVLGGQSAEGDRVRAQLRRAPEPQVSRAR